MNRQDTLALLERHQISPTKSLGQNFLTDDRIIDRIVDLAALAPEDLVLEIGPGIGNLTQALARRAGRVVAVEIDRHVLPALRETLAPFDNCAIMHADALTVDMAGLVAGWEGPVKIVANLPYYITTPLIIRCLIDLPACERMVLMIQKEAAARVLAGPGSKLYAPLAVLVSGFGAAHRELTVPADAFFPRPGVDSCLIRMIEDRKLQIDDWPNFHAFLEGCFAQRRRHLANSLKIAGMEASRLSRLPQALENLGLPADIRAEMLSFAQFSAIYQHIFLNEGS